jgi:putative metalloprotease
MKKKFVVLGVLVAILGLTKMNAQESSDKKELSLLDKTMLGFTFSDADAVAMAQKGITELDANNPVAEGKHSSS